MALSTRARLGLIAAVAAVAIVLALGIASHASRYEPQPVSTRNAVGDAVCLSCHQDKQTFETTAHRITSRLPTAAAFVGSFRPGENILRTENPALYYRMDARADGFHQTAVLGVAPDTTLITERVAYVTGSGRRGQSFLYWRGNALYQLPVSYWALFGWGNSPSYPDGRPNFDRPIPPRCLECHATYFERDTTTRDLHRYRDGELLGISCETCHAAGREHVERERSIARFALSPAIVNPARLPRARQLDQCALCHGGAVPLTTEPFAHVPGTAVHKQADLEIWGQPQQRSSTVDVHGDQVGLLARSRCFQQSDMTCSTCHDVHREQRDPIALSTNCLQCHTVRSCGLFPTRGQALEGQCATCHMPVQQSTSVISNRGGQQVRQPVRSHWIKVYPELR